MNTRLLGPMPTPGIAYLTRTLHAQAGIVISASHNPHEDNGIKFFSGDGFKLPDDVESAIEDEIEKPLTTVGSEQLGKAKRIEDAPGRYIEFCKSTIPPLMQLEDIKVVVDCAHGATYHVTPRVLDELGAQVVAIGVSPDGLNINRGVGSTHLSAVQQAVREHRADLGIALDGDGDRVIMVDDAGDEVDGDDLLYVIARSRQRGNMLRGAVVGTQMTNLGLEHALQRAGIALERTQVGDRYILERLRQEGWSLGGEPSGHIICLDRTTTGDGTVSALQVLAEMVRTGRSLRELRADVTKYPQRLVNVRLARGSAREAMAAPAVVAAVAAVERQLGDAGRVLLRASGTEPLVRVMVEGEDAVQVERLAEQIADAVRVAVG
jgi:phosphoglucosamine mutase